MHFKKPLWIDKYKVTIIASILLTVLANIPGSSQAEAQVNSNTHGLWRTIRVRGSVDNLFLDDRDGSIFVVIDGTFYRYSREFELITSVATGSNVASNKTSQKFNPSKLLLPIKMFNSDFIISCWQTLVVKCVLHRFDNVSQAAPFSLTRSFKAEPSQLILGIVASADNNYELIFSSNRLALDTGSTAPQNRSTYLPAISRFGVKNQPDGVTLELISVLPYKTELNDDNLMYEYIYIFTYEDHTYFILNDIHKPKLRGNISVSVKISRICNNDTMLSSYTEVPLNCNGLSDVQAKAAYFDSNRTDPTLYIVYESASLDYPKYKHVSSLCTYSIGSIRGRFTKAISDCNMGNAESSRLAKIQFDRWDAAIPCQRNPSDEWCLSQINPYIDGSSDHNVINNENHISLRGMQNINFVRSMRQGENEPRETIFLGTESGHVTKLMVIPNSDEEFLYTIDLNNNAVKSYNLLDKIQFGSKLNETSLGITRYSANNVRLIAATSGRYINELSFDSCLYYTNCRACSETTEPLDCIWCGTSCNRRSQCDAKDSGSKTTCPPIIRDIYPRRGPIRGHTKLTISGENFATPKGSMTIKVGDNVCSQLPSQSDINKVECMISQFNDAANLTVSVTAHDESYHIWTDGSAISTIEFECTEPELIGILPGSGPRKGPSLIEVFGRNLDIGSNSTIDVGGTLCRIVHKEIDRIKCSIETDTSIAFNSTSTIKMTIDDYEVPFSKQIAYGSFKNLSREFRFVDEPIDQPTLVKPTELAQSYLTSLILLIVVLIVATILLIYTRKYLIINLKKPSKLNDDDDATDMRVSFRNPKSNKFTDSNARGDSMNGLIKLNGSFMSTEYFGKLETIDQQDQPLMKNLLDHEMFNLLVQEKVLIDRSKLTLGHVLGSGQFGRVYKGFLEMTDTGEHKTVAVKTLHNRGSWEDADNRAFLEEGLMMKDFEHDNVLALIGVTFDSSGLPMVITPFMLYGDLRSYISDEASCPTVKELIDFGTQVARGMAYLSGLKFVHRDLAARNCMLDDNLVVKVADFGLSRDIYERDYYSSDNRKTKLPVKWMAIESLEKCIYNTKTDVWSYGVLLWELMTRGVVPYPDVDNFDLFAYLKEGRRMLRPRYCPVILYNIMLSCWQDDPSLRPTFDHLVVQVSEVITHLKTAKDGQQKVSRDETYCDLPT